MGNCEISQPQGSNHESIYGPAIIDSQKQAYYLESNNRSMTTQKCSLYSQINTAQRIENSSDPNFQFQSIRYNRQKRSASYIPIFQVPAFQNPNYNSQIRQQEYHGYSPSKLPIRQSVSPPSHITSQIYSSPIQQQHPRVITLKRLETPLENRLIQINKYSGQQILQEPIFINENDKHSFAHFGQNDAYTYFYQSQSQIGRRSLSPISSLADNKPQFIIKNEIIPSQYKQIYNQVTIQSNDPIFKETQSNQPQVHIQTTQYSNKLIASPIQCYESPQILTPRYYVQSDPQTVESNSVLYNDVSHKGILNLENLEEDYQFINDKNQVIPLDGWSQPALYSDYKQLYNGSSEIDTSINNQFYMTRNYSIKQLSEAKSPEKLPFGEQYIIEDENDHAEAICPQQLKNFLDDYRLKMKNCELSLYGAVREVEIPNQNYELIIQFNDYQIHSPELRQMVLEKITAISEQEGFRLVDYRIENENNLSPNQLIAYVQLAPLFFNPIYQSPQRPASVLRHSNPKEVNQENQERSSSGNQKLIELISTQEVGNPDSPCNESLQFSGTSFQKESKEKESRNSSPKQESSSSPEFDSEQNHKIVLNLQKVAHPLKNSADTLDQSENYKNFIENGSLNMDKNKEYNQKEVKRFQDVTNVNTEKREAMQIKINNQSYNTRSISKENKSKQTDIVPISMIKTENLNEQQSCERNGNQDEIHASTSSQNNNSLYSQKGYSKQFSNIWEESSSRDISRNDTPEIKTPPQSSRQQKFDGFDTKQNIISPSFKTSKSFEVNQDGMELRSNNLEYPKIYIRHTQDDEEIEKSKNYKNQNIKLAQSDGEDNQSMCSSENSIVESKIGMDYDDDPQVQRENFNQKQKQPKDQEQIPIKNQNEAQNEFGDQITKEFLQSIYKKASQVEIKDIEAPPQSQKDQYKEKLIIHQEDNDHDSDGDESDKRKKSYVELYNITEEESSSDSKLFTPSSKSPVEQERKILFKGTNNFESSESQEKKTIVSEEKENGAQKPSSQKLLDEVREIISRSGNNSRQSLKSSSSSFSEESNSSLSRKIIAPPQDTWTEISSQGSIAGTSQTLQNSQKVAEELFKQLKNISQTSEQNLSDFKNSIKSSSQSNSKRSSVSSSDI